MKNKRPFDKYALYEKAVQSPEEDVLFARKTYCELKKTNPKTLREDFCGTFQLCCEWVKLKKDHKACGIDVDSKPLHYGKTHHFLDLSEDQKRRIEIYKKSVLASNLPKVDIALAQNFSYYLFKERKDLKKYFKNVHKHLNQKGVFFLDAFGGPDSEIESEDQVDHGDFVYYWEQEHFNPVTRSIICSIHFKKKYQKKKRSVFVYDWRLWTLAELIDLLKEVGFQKIHCYWEGVDSQGEGNGIFKLVKKEKDCEACESWVTYLVCEK